MSINVRDVSFSYTEKKVLDSISFDAADGKLLAVLGPNGVGKTTLFRCILGLEKKYSGEITIDGASVRTLDARALAGKVAYIPQIRQQVFGYSVFDMVIMGTTHKLNVFGKPGKNEKQKALSCLKQMGIADLAEKDYGKISGGEQQLVLIARALAQNSANLLMDEPTSALDYGNQTRVMNAVRQLADEGYCVILSTHNPQHALWYADKALALSEGHVAAWDSPEAVMNKPLIERLYGINVSVIEADEGRLIMPDIKRK